MKATLVIVENDRDHQQAKALVEKLVESADPSDQARLIAQARLIEAYEQRPLAPSDAHAPAAFDVSDGPARPHAGATR
jgi:antitoxin component HigA of HigAB toxin-antitoxin module